VEIPFPRAAAVVCAILLCFQFSRFAAYESHARAYFSLNQLIPFECLKEWDAMLEEELSWKLIEKEKNPHKQITCHVSLDP
jgi:hypothetical protein